MSDESHRLKIERFFECFNRRDFEGMREVIHEDYVEEWPQSGERIRGVANQRAVLEHYPGLPAIDVQKVHGSEDRWVPTPAYTLLRITGTGDLYTVEQLVDYPSGERWHCVGIVEFRGDKLAKMTTYFASPFPAADWRSQWVETMEETPPQQERA